MVRVVSDRDTEDLVAMAVVFCSTVSGSAKVCAVPSMVKVLALMDTEDLVAMVVVFCSTCASKLVSVME